MRHEETAAMFEGLESVSVCIQRLKMVNDVYPMINIYLSVLLNEFVVVYFDYVVSRLVALTPQH